MAETPVVTGAKRVIELGLERPSGVGRMKHKAALTEDETVVMEGERTAGPANYKIAVIDDSGGRIQGSFVLASREDVGELVRALNVAKGLLKPSKPGTG